MREHSAEGEKILREVEGYDDIATVVRSHHERWDGAGYPDRIAGDQIPVLARVIAVADSYNAMTTARPYRGPMTPEEAIDQLVRGRARSSSRTWSMPSSRCWTELTRATGWGRSSRTSRRLPPSTTNWPR